MRHLDLLHGNGRLVHLAAAFATFWFLRVTIHALRHTVNIPLSSRFILPCTKKPFNIFSLASPLLSVHSVHSANHPPPPAHDHHPPSAPHQLDSRPPRCLRSCCPSSSLVILSQLHTHSPYRSNLLSRPQSLLVAVLKRPNFFTPPIFSGAGSDMVGDAGADEEESRPTTTNGSLAGEDLRVVLESFEPIFSSV